MRHALPVKQPHAPRPDPVARAPAGFQFRIAAAGLGEKVSGFAGGGGRRQTAEEFVGEMEPLLVGQAERRCFDVRELGDGSRLVVRAVRSRRACPDLTVNGLLTSEFST